MTPLERVESRIPEERLGSCKRTHNYFPSDLIQIFGDFDVDSLMDRMRCEGGDHGRLSVDSFLPTGSEAVGLHRRGMFTNSSHLSRAGSRRLGKEILEAGMLPAVFSNFSKNNGIPDR
ncbi:hypothetical protein ACG873_09460 [Mesorhizobium sp. AaZ16]|uniref:hypothetical protein n=1 Tax=Mesorhizobium sp. AaZ16 TaxID=3402289 RepID=UPI00374F78E4